MLFRKHYIRKDVYLYVACLWKCKPLSNPSMLFHWYCHIDRGDCLHHILYFHCLLQPKSIWILALILYLPLFSAPEGISPVPQFPMGRRRNIVLVSSYLHHEEYNYCIVLQGYIYLSIRYFIHPCVLFAAAR